MSNRRTDAQRERADYARRELARTGRDRHIEDLRMLIRQSLQRMERLRQEIVEEPKRLASLEKCLAEELRAKEREAGGS